MSESAASRSDVPGYALPDGFEYRISIEVIAYAESDGEAKRISELFQTVAEKDPAVAEYECWVGRNHAPRP